ncbi:hypothetical protein LUZ63_000290 [Rhynchospora breviuscula]|uniref:2Fe-2S ferredoxin-type domain-containing protein n=1 Tax=Rhynchospora breviuscula TaxID=2022672 RepID=A0A9Q0HW17_9POAL|nr:hypothetical protein LUZ63_000290 [Rhynchospora breviuscula]
MMTTGERKSLAELERGWSEESGLVSSRLLQSRGRFGLRANQLVRARVLRFATMFYRLSRLGFRILNETRVAQNSVTRRAIYRCSDQNMIQNDIWTNYHSSIVPRMYFSTGTTTSDNTQSDGNQSKEMISVTFVDKDGEEKHIKVPIGMSMLEAAHENDIELEGACEGSLACSTCHVIVMDVDYYNKLEDPMDEENDMLDLAFGLTETSRLGCQVIAKPELDGLRLALPAATRNFAVDGFVPKPH